MCKDALSIDYSTIITDRISVFASVVHSLSDCSDVSVTTTQQTVDWCQLQAMSCTGQTSPALSEARCLEIFFNQFQLESTT